MDRGSYFFHTRQMTAGYGGVPFVREIEIGLNKGEILTLIGPNGAGKTTILKSIIGQLPLIDGAVVLMGREIDKLAEKERAETVSVVLTERAVPEYTTCAEVVSMGRYPYTGRLGFLSPKDEEKVRESMELVRIGDLFDREFSKLSDGQKQLVLLARAIAQEPEILVLDEPTSFLDIRYKLEFFSALQSMARERELTVILSLHELDMAERISDRVLCVKDGCIDRFGTTGEVFTTEYISAFYGVEPEELNGLGKWRWK